MASDDGSGLVVVLEGVSMGMILFSSSQVCWAICADVGKGSVLFLYVSQRKLSETLHCSALLCFDIWRCDSSECREAVGKEQKEIKLKQ